jgi:hypothetical protein
VGEFSSCSILSTAASGHSRRTLSAWSCGPKIPGVLNGLAAIRSSSTRTMSSAGTGTSSACRLQTSITICCSSWLRARIVSATSSSHATARGSLAPIRAASKRLISHRAVSLCGTESKRPRTCSAACGCSSRAEAPRIVAAWEITASREAAASDSAPFPETKRSASKGANSFQGSRRARLESCTSESRINPSLVAPYVAARGEGRFSGGVTSLNNDCTFSHAATCSSTGSASASASSALAASSLASSDRSLSKRSCQTERGSPW